MKKNGFEANITHLLIVFFGALLLGFIFRRVAFMFFIILLFVLLGVSVYYFYQHLKAAKKRAAFQKSMEGSIEQNLRLCEEQISKNELELVDIQENINEIKAQMDEKNGINEKTIRESEFLLAGFDRELDLRKAKLDFYKTCKNKILNIQRNHQLAEKIALKKEKLKQLQEDHYEDLAEMEQLRSDMDYTKSYIETINNLSVRMAESTSLNAAQELHHELKLITKELRDL